MVPLKAGAAEATCGRKANVALHQAIDTRAIMVVSGEKADSNSNFSDFIQRKELWVVMNVMDHSEPLSNDSNQHKVGGKSSGIHM